MNEHELIEIITKIASERKIYYTLFYFKVKQIYNSQCFYELLNKINNSQITIEDLEIKLRNL